MKSVDDMHIGMRGDNCMNRRAYFNKLGISGKVWMNDKDGI